MALVVGLGRMGTFHAAVLADLGHDVTTVDPDPGKGADYATVGQAARARVYDVACVAVPIPMLGRTAASVAMAIQPEYLLVEKPFPCSTEEAATWLPVLLGRDMRVGVGYVERFNPSVLALKGPLAHAGGAVSATFTRHNDRPSHDVDVDLRSHDIDLARYLGVPIEACTFDTRAPMDRKQRTLTVQSMAGVEYTADLMAHGGNPLRDMWEAFLEGSPDVATVEDAMHVVRTLEHSTRMQEAA